jgi:hypothetical protein
VHNVNWTSVVLLEQKLQAEKANRYAEYLDDLAEPEAEPGRIRQLMTRLLSTNAKVRPIDTALQSEPAGESAQPASPTPLRPREA